MYDFPICIVLIESMSSVLYHISIPPESLPFVTPLSLVDGKIISLNPIGQPVDKSLTFHVSCSIIVRLSLSVSCVSPPLVPIFGCSCPHLCSF